MSEADTGGKRSSKRNLKGKIPEVGAKVGQDGGGLACRKQWEPAGDKTSKCYYSHLTEKNQ